MYESEHKEVSVPTSGGADDSGNVQTLSPAFRVDSMAGIEDIMPYCTVSIDNT